MAFGTNCSFFSYGITPLHVAAAADYPEMIDLLIDNGGELLVSRIMMFLAFP